MMPLDQVPDLCVPPPAQDPPGPQTKAARTGPRTLFPTSTRCPCWDLRADSGRRLWRASWLSRWTGRNRHSRRSLTIARASLRRVFSIWAARAGATRRVSVRVTENPASSRPRASRSDIGLLPGPGSPGHPERAPEHRRSCPNGSPPSLRTRSARPDRQCTTAVADNETSSPAGDFLGHSPWSETRSACANLRSGRKSHDDRTSEAEAGWVGAAFGGPPGSVSRRQRRRGSRRWFRPAPCRNPYPTAGPRGLRSARG